MADYLTVGNAAEYSFTEKKSRFIGYISPVKTEEEAVEFVNSIKKKHSDARHNVYAYVLRENNKQRYSDDGEPQGTGGLPVLDVLTKKGLVDVCVVVTRYFGGILLGTGGLTRAYSAACKGAVECGKIVKMTECKSFSLECDYGFYNTLQNLFMKFEVKTETSDFSDTVKLCCYIKSENYQKLTDEIAEKFSGKIVAKVLGEKYFPFSID